MQESSKSLVIVCFFFANCPLLSYRAVDCIEVMFCREYFFFIFFRHAVSVSYFAPFCDALR